MPTPSAPAALARQAGATEAERRTLEAAYRKIHNNQQYVRARANYITARNNFFGLQRAMMIKADPGCAAIFAAGQSQVETEAQRRQMDMAYGKIFSDPQYVKARSEYIATRDSFWGIQRAMIIKVDPGCAAIIEKIEGH